MAKKKAGAKKASVKTASKKSASKKSASKKSASKKSTSAKRKGPKVGSTRLVYPEALQLKVVKAIRKGMTHLEASEFYKVGRHSIPNWLKKHL